MSLAGVRISGTIQSSTGDAGNARFVGNGSYIADDEPTGHAVTSGAAAPKVNQPHQNGRLFGELEDEKAEPKKGKKKK